MSSRGLSTPGFVTMTEPAFIGLFLACLLVVGLSIFVLLLYCCRSVFHFEFFYISVFLDLVFRSNSESRIFKARVRKVLLDNHNFDILLVVVVFLKISITLCETAATRSVDARIKK